MPYRRSAIGKVLWASVAVVCVARCASAEGGPRVTPDSNGLRNVSAFRLLNDSLDAGAGVYIGAVTQHRATSPAGAMIEYGDLVFAVDEVLRGGATRQLTLPYSRATRFVKSDYDQLWPDAALLNGAKVCIVVVPKAYDSSALPLDQAASNVWVGGPPEDSFGWVRRVLEIDRIARTKALPEALAALKRAALDDDGHISSFAIDKLSSDVLRSSPKEATEALRDILARADTAKLKENGAAARAMTRLSRAARDARLPVEARQADVRTLALLVTELSDPFLRSVAVHYLAIAATEKSFKTSMMEHFVAPNSPPLPFRASDVLSKDEIARLRKALRGMANDHDIEPVVKMDQVWVEDPTGNRDSGRQ